MERGFSTEEYREWFIDYEERLFRLDSEQLFRFYQLIEEMDDGEAKTE